jgi:genome maintenance exonuclease 1
VLINPIYNYVPLVREDSITTGRKYILPDSSKVSSVTTILSSTKDTTHLDIWRKRIGEDNAKQITSEAADLGTNLHSHLESYLLEKERPGGNNYGRLMAKKMADTVIDNGLVHINEIWGVEVQVYFENLWVGTCDGVGLFKNIPSIIDFKNTIRPKKSEWINDYRMQVVAYALAHNFMFGTNINQGVIFMVSRNYDYQEFIVNGKEFEYYKIEWLKRVYQYYSL